MRRLLQDRSVTPGAKWSAASSVWRMSPTSTASPMPPPARKPSGWRLRSASALIQAGTRQASIHRHSSIDVGPAKRTDRKELS